MEQPLDVQPLDYPLIDGGLNTDADTSRGDIALTATVEELENSPSLTYAMLFERFRAEQPITEAMIRRADLNLNTAQQFPIALSTGIEESWHANRRNASA